MWDSRAPAPPSYVPLNLPPVTLDELERFLVKLFLRRYVTYCVRRRRSTSANEAARLYRRISRDERPVSSFASLLSDSERPEK